MKIALTIPFALDMLGRLVAARDLPKPAPGPFQCAACRSPLVLKQGEVRSWHFSHRPGTDCKSGFETALHLLAKQILLECRQLRAPALVCRDDSSLREDITVCEEQTICWHAAGKAEKWVDGIRPDFVADYGDQLLIIEVVVTNEPDPHKLAQLERIGMPALEINLSHVDREITVEALSHQIIDTVIGKRWLFYPGWTEALSILETRLKEEEAEAATGYARERAVVRRERAAALAQQATIRRQLDRANEVFRSATAADKKAFLARKLGLAEREWPPVLGGAVRGASSVNASARIWQTDVFRKFIYGQRSLRDKPTVTVQTVAEWLTHRYAVSPAASTRLRVAVWDFLSALETHGYLFRRMRQEFEILKDVLPGHEQRGHTLHPAVAVTRGLLWSSNHVEESELYLASEQTGIPLSPEAVRHLKASRLVAVTRSEAEFTRSVSAALRVSLERTVEFLVAAGIFVRIC